MEQQNENVISEELILDAEPILIEPVVVVEPILETISVESMIEPSVEEIEPVLEMITIDDLPKARKPIRVGANAMLKNGTNGVVTKVSLNKATVKYTAYEEDDLPQFAKGGALLTGIPSTDPSTWDGEFEVGDFVKIRKDFNSSDDIYRIEKYDVVSGRYKDGKGINIGGLQRPQNESGKLYQLNNVNTGISGGNWEGKDLELFQANPNPTPTPTPPKGLRPSPTQSAAATPIGTRMVGNDGKMYEVKDYNGIHRWVKVKEEPKEEEFDFDDLDIIEDLVPVPDVIVMLRYFFQEVITDVRGGVIEEEYSDGGTPPVLSAKIFVQKGLEDEKKGVMFSKKPIAPDQSYYIKIGDIVKFKKDQSGDILVGEVISLDYVDEKGQINVNIKTIPIIARVGQRGGDDYKVEGENILGLYEKELILCNSCNFLYEIDMFLLDSNGVPYLNPNYSFIMPSNIRGMIYDFLKLIVLENDKIYYKEDEFNLEIGELDDKLIKYLLIYIKTNPEYFKEFGVNRLYYDKLHSYLENLQVGYSWECAGTCITAIEDGFLLSRISKNPPSGYFYRVSHFKIVENKIVYFPRKNSLGDEFGLWYSLMDFTYISSPKNYTFTKESTEEWFRGMNNFLTLLSNK